MKILITGANGFFASRFISYYKNTYELYPMTHTQLDITDWTTVEKIMSQIHPDLVLHCAALSSTSQCQQNPELSYLINVTGTANLALACQKYHVKLIFCSSDQVYFGTAGTLPHTEAEALTPCRIYGQHKLMAECLCSHICPDSVLLRLSWMYDTKKLHPNEHDSLFTTLEQAISSSTPLRLPVYDVRSITCVWDLIEQMDAIFSLPGGVYNFGSPNDCSTFEIAQTIMFHVKHSSKLLIPDTTSFSKEPRNLRMDISKLLQYGIDLPPTKESLTRLIR